MTVLKTMFTAIVVACVLIFLTSALGWMDFAQLSVNPTYMWPGIIGGLIMGVGFIVGGYCPGTSIVSAASFKLDGIAFSLGTLLGVGFFGESVKWFSAFWNSSYQERVLVSDWLGWSVGATVVGVVVMALAMFYGAEKTEEYFSSERGQAPIRWFPTNYAYVRAGAGILALALVVWGIGQPSAERKWQAMGARYAPMLSSREVFVHPLEYVKTWNDPAIRLNTLDLRDPQEFAKFHLEGSVSVTLRDLDGTQGASSLVTRLLGLPSQGVVLLISDQEALAVQAWKWLKVQGVSNLYILEGGIPSWLVVPNPSMKLLEGFPKDAYQPKIKLKTNKKAGGLCG